uniref:Uncharacterized protein n=1 Tax=Plectus sambesii TaxID=2011161 RepID=A0A914UT96_9BILA
MEPNIRGDIRRIWVFIVTFISYCLYHASRKTLSSVKSTITQEWLHSGENFSNESHAHNFFDNAKDAETFLGTLDAVFMGVYAATMFYWGWLGDRLDPRTVVAVGMFGSGIT